MDPSTEFIDISDDEEGVDWDLLEKKIDEEEESEMKRKDSLLGVLAPVSSLNRVFASSTFPGPYAGRRLILGVVSCCSEEEYKRFLDSFKGK